MTTASLRLNTRAGAAERGRVRPPSVALTLVVLVATILVLLFMVYPVAYVFYGSFKPAGGMLGGGGFTLANYRRIFESGFYTFTRNSIVICLAATAVSTFVSVCAAYVFSRYRFRGRRVLFGAVMLGQVFPWIVLVNPLFVAFARWNITNSYAGMVFCYTAFTIPFSVYMLAGYLATVPRSLDEAATIDGASRFQVLWRIVVPIMLPGIVATATYAFLLCWTEYLFALAFLTQTDMKTLPLGLYQFFGDDRVDWGAVMAASAIATLPTIALFLPLQSRLASGLAAGAVK